MIDQLTFDDVFAAAPESVGGFHRFSEDLRAPNGQIVLRYDHPDGRTVGIEDTSRSDEQQIRVWVSYGGDFYDIDENGDTHERDLTEPSPTVHTIDNAIEKFRGYVEITEGGDSSDAR